MFSLRHGSDLFFEPTVIDGVTEDMDVAREETFGPVAPITRIRNEEEALAMVDRSEYGLLSAIYTADLRRGLRFAERVRTGWVNVNEARTPGSRTCRSAAGPGRPAGSAG